MVPSKTFDVTAKLRLADWPPTQLDAVFFTAPLQGFGVKLASVLDMNAIGQTMPGPTYSGEAHPLKIFLSPWNKCADRVSCHM